MKSNHKSLLTIFFVASIFIFSVIVQVAYASNYGEGSYGGGEYNVGETSSSDTTQPNEFNLDSPADGSYINNSSPTFRWESTSDDSGISKYQVLIDGEVHIDDIDPDDPGSSDGHVREDDDKWVRYDGDDIEAYTKEDQEKLSDGEYSWKVRAIDTAGNNRVTGSRTIYIDTSAPTLQLDSLAQHKSLDFKTDSAEGQAFVVTDTTPTFKGTSDASSTIEITFSQNNTTKTCEAIVSSGSSWECTADKLSYGRHDVSIKATDQAGNTTTLPILYIVIGSGRLDTELTDTQTTPLDTTDIEQAEEATDEAEVEDQQEKQEIKTYDVKVKVLNDEGQPVAGANVTLFSTPRETTTDENGIAIFKDVEEGEHKVVIAYENQVGEQKVTLDGEVEEFEFTVAIKPSSPFKSPWVIGVISSLALGLVIVSVLFVRSRTATDVN